MSRFLTASISRTSPANAASVSESAERRTATPRLNLRAVIDHLSLDAQEIQTPAAVAELVHADAGLIQHREEQVRDWRVRRVPEVTPERDASVLAAKQQRRQVTVLMHLRVAHARAVDE